MPITRLLHGTAHGLLDLEFKRNALPSILPGIYLAGVVPAVLIPLFLCILAFQHSWLAGVIAILCLPLAIVAGVVVVRFLLEMLLSIGALTQILARVVMLILGLNTTMADVSGAVNAVATGVRAVPRPKRSERLMRKRRHRRNSAEP